MSRGTVDMNLNTHLAWHTTGAVWKCQPAGFHWEAHRTGWTRHRWHTARGYMLLSSTQFSGSKQQADIEWCKEEGNNPNRTRSLLLLVFCFSKSQDKTSKHKQPWDSATSDLCLLLGELHVVKDAEDDSEEVVPPMLLERVAITLHDLKHDCEASVNKDKQFSLTALQLGDQREQRGHNVGSLQPQYEPEASILLLLLHPYHLFNRLIVLFWYFWVLTSFFSMTGW